MRSHDIESLLAIDLMGRETGFITKLDQVIRILNGQRVKYVASGALALSIYTVPRFTDTIEVLCRPEDKARIALLLGNPIAAIEPSIPALAAATVNIVIRKH